MSAAAQVPEPSTMILVGAALLTLVVIAWVRARRPGPRPPKKAP